MGTSESVRSVESASLQIQPQVTEAARTIGQDDDRFSDGLLTRTARLVIAAWVMATEGDDSVLASIATADAVHWLMHPVRQHWQVAPGPTVTSIDIWKLATRAEPPLFREPPLLSVSFRVAGRRAYDRQPGDQGQPGDEADIPFIGILNLSLRASDAGHADGSAWPWQLTSGHISTLDQYLGYTFTARRETADEYQRRTGAAEPPAGQAQARGFRLVASFAEHDERFSATITVEVRSDSAPTREEAERLVAPAIGKATSRALGDGDWRPSLSSLTVIELLD